MQRLNIELISNHPTSKCLLYKNNKPPSIILVENFRDSQEWILYNYVGVEDNYKINSKYSDDDSEHSAIKFFCVVARKPG